MLKAEKSSLNKLYEYIDNNNTVNETVNGLDQNSKNQIDQNSKSIKEIKDNCNRWNKKESSKSLIMKQCLKKKNLKNLDLVLLD